MGFCLTASLPSISASREGSENMRKGVLKDSPPWHVPRFGWEVGGGDVVCGVVGGAMV